MKYILISCLLFVYNILSLEQFDSDSLRMACQNTHIRLCSEQQYVFSSEQYKYAIHDGNEVAIQRDNILQSIVYNEMKRGCKIPVSVQNIASFTISSLLQDRLFLALQDNTFLSEGVRNDGVQWIFSSKMQIIDFCKEVYRDYKTTMMRDFIKELLETLHNLKNEEKKLSLIITNHDTLTIEYIK